MSGLSYTRVFEYTNWANRIPVKVEVTMARQPDDSQFRRLVLMIAEVRSRSEVNTHSEFSAAENLYLELANHLAEIEVDLVNLKVTLSGLFVIDGKPFSV